LTDRPFILPILRYPGQYEPDDKLDQFQAGADPDQHIN
jgi:hypothetical protein